MSGDVIFLGAISDRGAGCHLLVSGSHRVYSTTFVSHLTPECSGRCHARLPKLTAKGL